MLGSDLQACLVRVGRSEACDTALEPPHVTLTRVRAHAPVQECVCADRHMHMCVGRGGSAMACCHASAMTGGQRAPTLGGASPALRPKGRGAPKPAPAAIAEDLGVISPAEAYSPGARARDDQRSRWAPRTVMDWRASCHTHTHASHRSGSLGSGRGGASARGWMSAEPVAAPWRSGSVR